MTNDNDNTRDALVNEAAERIANDEAELSGREEREEAIVQAAIPILADFKRAIELQQQGEAEARPPIPPSLATRATVIALRLATLPDATKMDDVVAEIADELSSWTVAEPELAKLIEEARRFSDPEQRRLLPFGAILKWETIGELATALEQQIAARREAEINWKAGQAQGFHWFNAAVAARTILARIIDDLPKHRDWLDPALEREAVAIANDDKPTESDKAKVSE